MLDYETLRIIWWALIGILMIGFVLTDGFDMGVGMLLRTIGKTNEERRVMINAMGPHWDGNQVWLVTAAGALFAAWPNVYAAAFSGFYFAMLIVLFALFFRPLAFEYRAKIDSDRWRSRWDNLLMVGSGVPPLIIGVAFGNLLLGVPFHYDDWLIFHYTGGFFGLLRPFALVVGVFSVLMFINHGAVFLQLKTDSKVLARAEKIGSYTGLLTALFFAFIGIWLYFGIKGYHVTSPIDTHGASIVTLKTVSHGSEDWFFNYQRWPIIWLFPIFGVIGFLLSSVASTFKRHVLAFLTSSLGIFSSMAAFAWTTFPFIMPSSTMPDHSLTIWDATASQNTLMIMFVVACIFVPIVLSYTAWSYYVMRGRMKQSDLNEHSY